MSPLWNIAMHDYQESVTTGQTCRRTDGWTDTGQSDPCLPLCFAGNTKMKCSSRVHWPPSFFFHQPKITNLVEDVEILLTVKFRYILFRDSWGEVENVSAKMRPGLPSCFSDRPEKHNVGKKTLRSCFLSSFIEFCSAVSEEKSRMSHPSRG